MANAAGGARGIARARGIGGHGFGRAGILLGVLALGSAGAAVAEESAGAGVAEGERVTLPAIEVVGEKLDRARNALSPTTGSSEYRFDASDLAALPAGEHTPVNGVMLQAPGVVLGDFGELHIRGEMTQPQYRINGVVIPEGISGFGQVFDTNFVERMEFLDGALPAQYGYRTAGVVEIQTKKSYTPGGSIGVYGGSHGTFNPAVEWYGSRDALNWYVTGNFNRNDLGILSPVPEADPLHDRTSQTKGFAYLSYVPDGESRASLIFGSAVSKFQIPSRPGLTPTYSIDGAGTIPDLPSSALDENQREVNHYAVLSWQASAASGADYQIALFSRYTSVLYQPDPIGDLIYTGVASRVFRSNTAVGLQGDASLPLGPAHTLRAGFSASSESTDSNNDSFVFATDANGVQAAGGPLEIRDNHSKNGLLVGLYLQDEWRATERLTVNYGVRVDAMRAYVDRSQLSPRLGATYKLASETTVHAGYSRYFTPPRLELIAPETLVKYQNTTNAPEVSANGDVLPERMHYFDIGIAHRLSPEITVGLDAYYKYARQLGDFGQFGQALVFSPFNWDRATIRGIELSAAWRRSNWSANLNIANSSARAKGIVSGQYNFEADELSYINANSVYMDHDQRWTASGGIACQCGFAALNATFVFGSGMRRGFANSDHLPSYTQVDLGASRTLQTDSLGRVDLRLTIVNVLDRIYEIRDGTGIGVGAPQFGPRRAFYAGITKRF